MDKGLLIGDAEEMLEDNEGNERRPAGETVVSLLIIRT
jgi:hypothetical protein